MKNTGLLAIVMAVVLCSTWLGIVFYPSDQDFMKSNPSWNGLQDFSEKYHTDMLNSLDDIESATGSVLLTIPYLKYGSNDLQKISDFVRNGGTLLVMDDYSYGNQVLEALDLGMSFDGKPMLDPYLCYHNEKLPIIDDFALEIQEAGVKNVILNHATALVVTGQVQILAQSSPSAFIDRNENLTLDRDEPLGPFVMAAKVNSGKGTVIAVADPSILINSMEDRGDNETFIRTLMSVAGENPRIYVDTTHLPKKTIDHAKDFWKTVKEKMSNPYGLVLLVGGILTLTMLPLLRKGDRVGQK